MNIHIDTIDMYMYIFQIYEFLLSLMSRARLYAGLFKFIYSYPPILNHVNTQAYSNM